MCAFTTKGPDGRPSFVLTGMASEGAPGAFGQHLGFNGAFGHQEVSDLGAEAVWDEKLGTLLVRVDSKRVLGVAIVVSGRAAGPDDRQRVTWLARNALARL